MSWALTKDPIFSVYWTGIAHDAGNIWANYISPIFLLVHNVFMHQLFNIANPPKKTCTRTVSQKGEGAVPSVSRYWESQTWYNADHEWKTQIDGFFTVTVCKNNMSETASLYFYRRKMAISSFRVNPSHENLL